MNYIPADTIVPQSIGACQVGGYLIYEAIPNGLIASVGEDDLNVESALLDQISDQDIVAKELGESCLVLRTAPTQKRYVLLWIETIKPLADPLSVWPQEDVFDV